MKYILCLSLFWACAQGLAQELNHKQLALEYIELSNLKFSFTQQLEDLDIEGLDPSEIRQFNEHLDNVFAWKNVKDEALIQVMENYSAKDLLEVNKFLKTPAGKLFTTKHPQIDQKLKDFLIPNILEGL